MMSEQIKGLTDVQAIRVLSEAGPGGVRGRPMARGPRDLYAHLRPLPAAPRQPRSLSLGHPLSGVRRGSAA